jgi:hypothetical protein
MPFDETKPLIAAAFTCEKVLEQAGPIYSVIRIVDKYTVSLTPLGVVSQPNMKSEAQPMVPKIVNEGLTLDMNAFIALKAGHVTGPHTMAIAVRDPENNERVVAQHIPVEFKLDDPAETFVVNLKLVMPNNAPTGRYWINVLWDSELLTKIPVTVHRELPEFLVPQSEATPPKSL